MMADYFYDKQIRRYIQQFIRLFSGFSVQMGVSDDRFPIFQKVPVRYGDISRMAAHIQRENSENVTNTVPFVSCYVTSLDMSPSYRMDQTHIEKLPIYEKKIDPATGEYLNEVGRTYTVERHMPVPYKLVMNCDVWTSNTDQKLQLLEQILVLFNPTLNIQTTSNGLDWSRLAYVEMTNTIWSSRSVGSSIDDIIDVATLTFEMPIWINPPAKVKQQKLIHTVLNELYNLDDADLDAFKNQEPFDTSTLQYTVITFEDRKLRYIDGNAYLLNSAGVTTDDGGNTLEWQNALIPFGALREGISQLRLRKSNNPGDTDNDIIGRLSYHPTDPNALIVDIDVDTLPSNTLSPITGVINPARNFPGDGVVPVAEAGQRYLLQSDMPTGGAWGAVDGKVNDIVQYNGSGWIVVFDASSISGQHYVYNATSADQLEWNGTDWFNSYEGVYKAGYWRIYL
jgi:hypothetical protein